jgi:hypothetical protein
MKRKPSDYSRIRYLKKTNLPPGGSVFTITDLDEVNKSPDADQLDLRIRLTLDEHWWFELKGGNLDTVIDLLGDDFATWLHGRIGLRVAEFTARDGTVGNYIQVVAASEIEQRVDLKAPADPDPDPETLDEIPF